MEKMELNLGVGDIIATIKVKSCTLLVCFGSENELSIDNSVQKAIESNIEAAFDSIVKKIDDNTFFLEIRTTEDYGNFPWEDGWSKNLLNRQLSLCMPLIQKFISDAMTDTL